jgi:hypothetical protein
VAADDLVVVPLQEQDVRYLRLEAQDAQDQPELQDLRQERVRPLPDDQDDLPVAQHGQLPLQLLLLQAVLE